MNTNTFLNELSLVELMNIEGGSFYNVFIRFSEFVFVGTLTAVGNSALPIIGGAAGAVVGEVAWEAMFGNSFAGDLLR